MQVIKIDVISLQSIERSFHSLSAIFLRAIQAERRACIRVAQETKLRSDANFVASIKKGFT